MCYYKEPTGEPCGNKVSWKVKPEKAPAFKVCDKHLPWSLHFCGLPAKVELPEDETQRIKTGTYE